MQSRAGIADLRAGDQRRAVVELGRARRTKPKSACRSARTAHASYRECELRQGLLPFFPLLMLLVHRLRLGARRIFIDVDPNIDDGALAAGDPLARFFQCRANLARLAY